MALTPGTRLGPYEIVAPLGAGGMGTACGPREQASLRAAQRERVGVGPHAHQEKQTAGPCL